MEGPTPQITVAGFNGLNSHIRNAFDRQKPKETQRT
jgi:hypothetical protein